ncbi:MAG: serine hydrolase domain-containing protein [Corynebacterium pyruviciproducens]|uniref:serine hydrolase domain-containing protein n=1 Tax=Corynebacterium pyruviciproducens TaxID=598660 RepID=UPI00288B0094|nr:serine hydrolase domain-containing protein [Corynebacterium pyruviciproducens]
MIDFASWPCDRVAAASTSDLSFGETSGVFELASVTKLLSAYAVLVAVEEGVFSLSTPLGPPGSTVRHLLAHSSGLGHDDLTPLKSVETRRIYSSSAYALLGAEIEKQTDIPFGAYAREAVFEPLGMTHTEIYGNPGFGGRSTVDDLLLFIREVLNPRVLHPSTVDEATTIQFQELRGVVPGYGPYEPCPWGLGFEIKGEKNPHWTGPSMPADTIGHFGQAGTYLWVHRPSGRGMVVLTDRAFGEWAKPLWMNTNEEIWVNNL